MYLRVSTSASMITVLSEVVRGCLCFFNKSTHSDRWLRLSLSSLCEFLVAIAPVSPRILSYSMSVSTVVSSERHGLCVFDNRLLIRNAVPRSQSVIHYYLPRLWSVQCVPWTKIQMPMLVIMKNHHRHSEVRF